MLFRKKEGSYLSFMEEVVMPEINEIVMSSIFTHEHSIKEVPTEKQKFDFASSFFPHLFFDLRTTINNTNAWDAWYKVVYLHQVEQGWIKPEAYAYSDWFKDKTQINGEIYKAASDYMFLNQDKYNCSFWFYLSEEIAGHPRITSRIFKSNTDVARVMEEYLETYLIPQMKRKLKKFNFTSELQLEHSATYEDKIKKIS